MRFKQNGLFFAGVLVYTVKAGCFRGARRSMEGKADMERRDKEGLIMLSGLVETVVFQNEESGFAVCELDVAGQRVTAVGVMPFLAAGEEVRVSGQWRLHPVYGRQFSVEQLEKRLPSNVGAILRYLSSGAVKGVGAVTAQRIVDMFGENALSVIENEPDKLCRVRGISPKKAAVIQECFQKQFGVRNVLMLLQQYGITMSLALKIWKRWGSLAVDTVKDNPYILCEEIDGVGFVRADQIAQAMGFDPDSDFRRGAGIKHVLHQNLSNGHTFLPLGRLCEVSARLLAAGRSEDAAQAKAILSKEHELVKARAQKLIENGELIVADGVKSAKRPDMKAVYLRRYYYAERYIAETLRRIDISFDNFDFDVEQSIADLERRLGISYAEKQKEAIRCALSRRVFILTGGPGTGKTTTLNGIVHLFDKCGFKTLLTAPTGRAAKRITELTGRPAKTVHLTLGMKRGVEGYPVFSKNEQDKLDCDALVCDEMSMMDVPLFEALLKALPEKARLILVGDVDQLPPVGPGNVFKDMIRSRRFAVTRLGEIFRQAQESLIVVNAHKIIRGEPPELSARDRDFFFLPAKSAQETARTVVELCSRRLPKAYGLSPVWDIQVLCPTRRMETGTAVLNELLRQRLNPPDPGKRERRVRETVFREGDKVIQTRNNYDIPWEKDDGELGTVVLNGEVGLLERLDDTFEKAYVRFDDRTAEYDYAILDELEHAYAITVHKSQGSEYPVVVLPVWNGPEMLFHRNLLYTGITRARQYLILTGSESKITQMIENFRQMSRYTGLRCFLRESGDVGDEELPGGQDAEDEL